MFRRTVPILAVAAVLLSAGCSKAPPANAAGFRTLFSQGQTFQQFLATADFRKTEWQTTYRNATVPDSVLARARAVPGTWRLLVVAADWCPDSYHIVPYLAKLSEDVPGIRLRLVSTGPGKSIMDAYRTPDDRAATPVVLILNDDFQERGCMVERPTALEQLYLAHHARGESNAEAHEEAMAWYEQDHGRSTLSEIVDRLAAAAGGSPICPARQEH
ncbi:MAG: thioredoxin family protein [Gemmatimonadota bacterium]